MQKTPREHLLRIGDIARQTGKSVRAIHLYEEQGLLTPATRSSGGFRLFEASAVERVRWIDLLHTLGFSLSEMRELVRTWWSAGVGPRAMDELRTLFESKLAATRDAIQRHQQVERELAEGLSYLETCRWCAQPATLDVCASCPQDHGTDHEPALVAGLTQAPGSARARARTGFIRLDEIE